MEPTSTPQNGMDINNENKQCVYVCVCSAFVKLVATAAMSSRGWTSGGRRQTLGKLGPEISSATPPTISLPALVPAVLAYMRTPCIHVRLGARVGAGRQQPTHTSLRKFCEVLRSWRRSRDFDSQAGSAHQYIGETGPHLSRSFRAMQNMWRWSCARPRVAACHATAVVMSPTG